ncbi:uncharacterized protein LOC119655125 [Hermetia illucens]|nr:uncharacterized protein LOC119655125 [Hermetia illucens]
MKEELSISNRHRDSNTAANILDKELKNLRKFKKVAPESIIYRVKNFEKYCKIIDNILYKLLDHTNILLCFRQMLIRKDPLVADFPQKAVETLSAFLRDDTFNYGSSHSTVRPARLDIPFPEISMEMVHIVEYINANRLMCHLSKFSTEFSPIEIQYIDYVKRLKKIYYDRLNVYTNQIYFSTEYFRNLKFANENYQARIRELQFDLRLSTISFENAKINHDEKLKLFLYKEMIAEGVYGAKLQEKRYGTTPQIAKLTKTLNEDRTTREQSLENLKNLYESTVEKDQKRCKLFADTRYKREVAVLAMIEKYDRDYGSEYKRLEALTEKYNQLTKKSEKLDEDLSALMKKNLFIYADIEAQKQHFIVRRNNRVAIVIQRWWRNILKRRFRGLSANLKSQQRLSRPSGQKSRKGTMTSARGTKTFRGARKSDRKVTTSSEEISLLSETQTGEERSRLNSSSSEDETKSASTKKLQPEINLEEIVSTAELPSKKVKRSKTKPKKNKPRN